MSFFDFVVYLTVRVFYFFCRLRVLPDVPADYSRGLLPIAAVAVLQRRTASPGIGSEERDPVDRERAGQRQLDGKQLQDDQWLAAEHHVASVPVHQ